MNFGNMMGGGGGAPGGGGGGGGGGGDPNQQQGQQQPGNQFLPPQQAQAHHDPDMMSWYLEIPIVSRCYLTGAFLCTSLCAVDVLSPFNLYFNLDLIVHEKQFWRLVSSYLFFGTFSVDFLFHMYFLVRYSRLLEEGDFRGRTMNYVLMLVFGILNISLVATYTNVHFLGSALTFMMVYVWGRRNPDVKMSFLGFFTFNAPYLPWVMLGFSSLVGNGVTMDLIGIVVGHNYYFLEYVYPIVAEIRGWKIKKLLVVPTITFWNPNHPQQHNADIIIE